MPPYIKWRVFFAVSIFLVSCVLIAGCLTATPTNNQSKASATPVPTVIPQKQVVTPTPVAQDTMISAPHVVTEPKQTVYNSPENGPRMPDIKGVPAPTITPTPKPTITPTPTPIVIVR